MPKYICSQCQTEYDAMTADGFCTNQPDCEYGTGWLQEAKSASDEPAVTPDAKGPAAFGFEREVGLCVLMMDGSLSMNEFAFPGSDYPGNKYKLVSMNAAGGIWSLSTLTNQDDAYIALCVFAGKPKQIWIKNVSEIIEEYGTQEAFADYIYKTLEEETPDARFTNINDAVALAHGITQAFAKGDLTEYGGIKDFKPVIHPIVRSGASGEEFINIPNARVLIYTDGEHNVTAAVKNAFGNDEQSVLMSAFIGDENDKGVKQMQGLANTCPKHAPATGFFLINSPERVQTLKGLFRMASGASGFCPLCLKVEQQALDEEPDDSAEETESTPPPESEESLTGDSSDETSEPQTESETESTKTPPAE